MLALGFAGCRTAIGVDREGGFTAEDTDWAQTIHRWYPDQRSQVAAQTATEFAWADDLQRWYPDWQPPLSARLPRTTVAAAPRTTPVARPSTEVARPAPRPTAPSRPAPPPRIAPTTPERPPVATAATPAPAPAPATAPAPVVPATPAPATGGAPAETQAPLIVTEGGSQPAPSSAGDDGMRRHVIQRGESLHSISQRYYGTPDQWRRLVDANRNVLRNPNMLTIGTTIRIP